MQKNTQQIVVIGAGYAGLLAAVRLSGKTRHHGATVTLINASNTFVERLRLHQLAANQPIKQRPISDYLHGTGVQFIQGNVTAIETEQHKISVETPNGVRQIGYDKLLYALGSTIERDSVPGVRDHAYTLTPSGSLSAQALRDVLPSVAAKGGQMVVCGGGATGIEAAAEFASTYPNLKVPLITRGELGLFMGKDIATYMRKSLERWGVVIQDHTTIVEVTDRQVIINNGKPIPFDVCLWAGGFTVPALARESGLAVNDLGQILVDPFLRSTSHPDVYAVGDAAYPVEKPGVPVRMAAYTASLMGAHGADNLAALVKNKPQKPLSFAYAGQGIALGRHNAIGFNNYPADKPNRPYFTGRIGHEIRELFVRFLADAPNLERRFPGILYWLGKGRYARIQRTAERQTKVKQSV